MEVMHDSDSKVILSTEISALSTIYDKAHTWLLDSATSSHIYGNFDLFENLHSVAPVSIETSSRDVSLQHNEEQYPLQYVRTQHITY